MPTAPRQLPRRVIVLGSTGSIGCNTLEVIAHLREIGELDFQVVGLAAGRDAATVIAQAKRFGVEQIAMADVHAAKQVREALPDANLYTGEQSSLQLVENVEATDVVAAVVGSAGLPAAIAAVQRGMRLCLANKETLVAAGELVTNLLGQPTNTCHAEHAPLIPVDSEHSAIFQCLQANPTLKTQDSGPTTPANAQSAAGGPNANLHRIILTASGGPFRNCDKREIDAATPEQALQHPTWKMGPKISIDSATMMNKALEIIEAHWLFGLTAEQIEVIVHPESIVHSFVEFADHSVLAQLGSPDMRTPIQYALTYPHRATGLSRAMDWRALSSLNFQPPDFERFPALQLAYDVVRTGGTAGAVFNAANEAAVDAFLAGRIGFGQIVDLVDHALNQADICAVASLHTALQADATARRLVEARVQDSGRDFV